MRRWLRRRRRRRDDDARAEQFLADLRYCQLNPTARLPHPDWSTP